MRFKDRLHDLPTASAFVFAQPAINGEDNNCAVDNFYQVWQSWKSITWLFRQFTSVSYKNTFFKICHHSGIIYLFWQVGLETLKTRAECQFLCHVCLINFLCERDDIVCMLRVNVTTSLVCEGWMRRRRFVCLINFYKSRLNRCFWFRFLFLITAMC